MRVVLVGYGPVGARFVEEVLPAVETGRIDLTVVGAEPEQAYNRVLVSEFAANKVDRRALDIIDAEAVAAAGVRVLTGTAVTAIDRTARRLTLGDGQSLGYDRLVLATGARAHVPALAGLSQVEASTDPAVPADDRQVRGLPAGIVGLRDLADAEVVARAVSDRRRILVLGGGVLGTEAALAMADQGAEVVLIHSGPVPMARNLDHGGGQALARAARRAGVIMLGDFRATGVICEPVPGEGARFGALLGEDGERIPGDLLVLSAGVRARVGLAAAAGLPTAAGILVDPSLRSWADRSIFAIGDCAHVATGRVGAGAESVPGGPSGLIGPGWRQAEFVAAQLVAEAGRAGGPVLPETEERPPVVLLKADGVDVLAAGRVMADPWDSGSHALGCSGGVEVSQWVDPARGAYVKLVTVDDVLEGFVCVGMPRVGAELTVLYNGQAELPTDRSVLLRLDAPDLTTGGAVDRFAPEAVVCWCNGVVVKSIMDGVAAGDDSVECVGRRTRAGTGCGGCRGRIAELIGRQATVG